MEEVESDKTDVPREIIMPITKSETEKYCSLKFNWNS